MKSAAISIKHLHKTFRLPHEKQGSIKSAVLSGFKGHGGYEKQHVLNDITFDIKEGEFFGIVGRNGSGKSTLLKLLAGIYSPDSGEIQINGRLTPFIELGVGFNPELTGRENVFLNGALLGFSRAQMEALYEDIVEFAELENFMDQKLKNYSSGMQVRLAFSIAIRAKSDILLLDEVLAVGDLAFQEKCYKYFEQLKKDGHTVVFISHDGGAIQQFCDRAALIDKSKLIAIGHPRDIVLRYGALVAGDQYKEQRKKEKAIEQESEENVHKGNGAITIGDITLHGRNGERKTSVNFGEEFSVHVKYKLNSEIKDNVIVGIDFIDHHGVSILGPNTKEANKKMTIKSSGMVKIDLPVNPLSPGVYEITVGFFNNTSSMAYDLVEKITQFKIVGEHRHGKIYIEPAWNLVESK